jgi:aryl-alcohol dehydrogenase-like predicted oxidoreductase
MRYRPLGASGVAVSAVTLNLADTPGMKTSDWKALAYAALENGINSFEVTGRDPAILDGLAAALPAVARRLVFVGMRLGYSPEGRRDFSAATLSRTTQAAIARSGLEYLDLVMLDDPTSEEFTSEGLNALKELKREGKVNLLGVCGRDEAIEAYILTQAFNLLCLPYNMQSGWRDRHWMKLAQERDMAVVGYDFYPDSLRDRNKIEPISPIAKSGWLRRPPPAGPKLPDPYAFLDGTANWTAQEVCLAYALTEPALASVHVISSNPDLLTKLAEVPDRDLPNGLGSRVEMARFGSAAMPAAAKA